MTSFEIPANLQIKGMTLHADWLSATTKQKSPSVHEQPSIHLFGLSKVCTNELDNTIVSRGRGVCRGPVNRLE